MGQVASRRHIVLPVVYVTCPATVRAPFLANRNRNVLVLLHRSFVCRMHEAAGLISIEGSLEGLPQKAKEGGKGESSALGKRRPAVASGEAAAAKAAKKKARKAAKAKKANAEL